MEYKIAATYLCDGKRYEVTKLSEDRFCIDAFSCNEKLFSFNGPHGYGFRSFDDAADWLYANLHGIKRMKRYYLAKSEALERIRSGSIEKSIRKPGVLGGFLPGMGTVFYYEDLHFQIVPDDDPRAGKWI